MLGLALFNRGYLAPYDTATGQLVLILVGGVFAVAFMWLARMTRPVQVDRFLTEPHAIGTSDHVSGIRP
ncbi:MAG TPA: hypothetical protein VL961_00985 [Acidimicrobiales bacterium]|nr:hypothetical protein [Acidimicrobiales bacterium]